MAKTERSTTGITRKILRIIFGIVGLLLQGALFFLIFFGLPQYKPIYVIVEILAVLVVMSIFNSNANASYKLSWTIVILVLPFGGVLLYLLYGRGRSLPNRKNKKIEAYINDQIEHDSVIPSIILEDSRLGKMANVLYNNAHLPFYQNTSSQFLSDGSLFLDEIIKALRNAQKYIFMEYFIIKEGEMWEAIKSVLIERALDGVEIKIIYDDVGSRRAMVFPSVKILNQMPNIEMVPYNPLGKTLSLSVNYRDHRKILIVDGLEAFVGGINIGDEYVHLTSRFGFWRDNALKLKGEAIKNFIILFAEGWYMSTKKMIDIKKYIPTYPKTLDKGFYCPFGDGPSIIENPAYQLFKSMFSNANKYIYISTPYFIIDQEFLNSIIMAIKSGVDVRILVPHIPDKKTVFMMTQAHYGEILKAGGRIFEFSEGFNHAKNIICDDEYAFIGTVNIDYRSLFLHFECGTFMIRDENILNMKKDFLDAINKSEEITYEKWRKRSPLKKAIELLLSVTSPLL